VLAAGWIALGGGNYRQVVTLPAAYDYDKVQIGFRITSTGDMVYPTVERISPTQVYVYTNDNTLDYTAMLG
jgi:hypothetical protein